MPLHVLLPSNALLVLGWLARARAACGSSEPPQSTQGSPNVNVTAPASIHEIRESAMMAGLRGRVRGGRRGRGQ